MSIESEEGAAGETASARPQAVTSEERNGHAELLSLYDKLTLVLDGRVLVHAADGVALLTMNRPEKLNALDAAQIVALSNALRWVRESSEVRTVVLTGNAQSFSAGGDIASFTTILGDEALDFTQRGYDLLRPLEVGEKPIIAAVNGYCLAGGFELALACDMIIAGHSAVFGFGEVDLGLIPGWGGTVRLARAIPIRLARQWILTSQRLSAETVRAAGAVNEVVEDAEVLARAMQLAGQVARQPVQAVKAAKLVIEHARNSDLDAALGLERTAAAALFNTEEVHRRVDAWNARSVPREDS